MNGPSAVQLVIAAGALVGLGLALLAWRFVPAHPDLADALDRLSPSHTRGGPDAHPVAGDRTERLGQWGRRTLPPGLWGTTPTADLAILGRPVSRYYGEKLLFALLGLTAPPLMTLAATLAGVGPALYLPAAGSLALATVLFFVPNHNTRDDAAKARAEFTRALGTYIDLVALERHNGSGPRQAMEAAAAIGDSWVFTRLAEELARTRWSGQTPWEALRALGTQLALPELDELADIMRLSGEEGAQVYATLRARSASLRAAMLTTEKARANETAERMTIPMSLLGVIFLAILTAPSLLRLLGLST